MTAAILTSALARMIDRDDLAENEAYDLLLALADPKQSPAAVGAALAALEAKRASAAEIRGLAKAMRSLALRPVFDEGSPIADIAGTGGDRSQSLNISTGAALLAAACGVRVAKHGNRSVSSRAGSADTVAALGLPIPQDALSAAACMRSAGFAFLFAPHFHPAMKAVAPVRAALGIKTVFNLLGPLVNPAAPSHAVIGAFSLDAARLLAAAASGAGIERVFIVYGQNGWDEPTPAAPFSLFDVRPGVIAESEMSHRDFGLPACGPADLKGGDAGENAAALRNILDGRRRDGARDAVLMSASLLLVAVGVARTPADGAATAAAAIDDGRATELLARLAAMNRGSFDVC